MKQRNPRYGCPRIAQQINLAFGLELDKDIVRRILAVHYKPDPSCLTWQDEEGRVLSKALVENVQSRIHQQPATVTASSRKPKKQPPPLPYNLSALPCFTLDERVIIAMKCPVLA